jgi:hypothetical protein
MTGLGFTLAVIITLGLGLIVAGVAMLSVPLALIVAGIGIILGAVLLFAEVT